MRMQSSDTHVQTETTLIAMLRKATPHQKFAQIRSLSQTILSLSRRAILRKNAHLGEMELRALFVSCQYGEELGNRFMQYQKNQRNEEA